jgi:hypothetical protein
MLDRYVQPRLVQTEGQDNLIFPLPQPETLSLSREIVHQLKEDLGLTVLCYGFSQAARWMLIGRWDISARVPEFVVIALFTASILAPIFVRLSLLFQLTSELSIKFRDVSIGMASVAVASLAAKICHFPVSSAQGIGFIFVVFPAATLLHQLFEE